MISQIISNKEKIFNSENKNLNIDSIILSYNGTIESHFYNPDKLHELRSLSKVLTALAVGILIDRRILSLNTYIYPIIKDLAEINNKNVDKIRKVQIKHLLTYSMGYQEFMFNEKIKIDKNINDKEIINYILNYNLPLMPGEKFVYNNAEYFLLSVIVQQVTGLNLSEFVKKEIFTPLEVEEYMWKNYDIYCCGATGLFLSHKDFFKIGQLILNKGKYNRKQIISKDFIEKMCSCQLKTPYAIKPDRLLPKQAVGFVMHISREGYIFKDGTNGQYLIVNFDKNQLITILSNEKDMNKVTEILRGII